MEPTHSPNEHTAPSAVLEQSNGHTKTTSQGESSTRPGHDKEQGSRAASLDNESERGSDKEGAADPGLSSSEEEDDHEDKPKIKSSHLDSNSASSHRSIGRPKRVNTAKQYASQLPTDDDVSDEGVSTFNSSTNSNRKVILRHSKRRGSFSSTGSSAAPASLAKNSAPASAGALSQLEEPNPLSTKKKSLMRSLSTNKVSHLSLAK